MLSADRPEAATPPGSLEHISPEGEELLRMYEAIAAAFEAQPSSCSELAAGTEELIRANHAALTRWAEVQEELGSVGQGELEAAGRPRFQRVRDAFRAVLIRCASDQGLQAAMRKLAEAGMSG